MLVDAEIPTPPSEQAREAWTDPCYFRSGLGGPESGRGSETDRLQLADISKTGKSATEFSNLGVALELRGGLTEALANYRQALALDSNHRTARRNAALLLARLDKAEDGYSLWHEELLEADGLAWAQNVIQAAMRAEDLTLAGRFASVLARLRWGASNIEPFGVGRPVLPRPYQPEVYFTRSKLRHDVEQFRYLRGRGILGSELDGIMATYDRQLAELESVDDNARVELGAHREGAIGRIYNRIVHIRDTPRVLHALSQTWSAEAVETEYLRGPLGLVIIDDFLSADALESLRLFCLESTIWSTNRYAHGRLGSFFNDGFNCPLLLQIAEELRAALPKVIGDIHPLRQIWGFKNDYLLPPGSTTHADFAAVNVNFWTTPTEANMRDSSGGLLVYDLEAPRSWDFHSYNGRLQLINQFLECGKARAVNIPYRQNRAIIFNSDLFHATAEVQFRRGYENRRVNVTMLYGDRTQDRHHPDVAGRSIMEQSTAPRSWRSAAFTHARAPA